MSVKTACPWCKEPPALQTTKRAGPAWFSYKCVSAKCADRIVETHRFSAEEIAAQAWDGERVAG